MSSATVHSPIRLAIPSPVQPFRPEPFLAALNATIQDFPVLDAKVLSEEGKRVAGGLSLQALRGTTRPPADLHFRAWVDEWLQSGRTEDGSEDPSARTFLPAGEIPEVVRQYTTQKMSLVAVGAKLCPWLPESAEMEIAAITPNATTPNAATLNTLKTFWSSKDDFAAQLVMFLLSSFRFKLAQCPKCRIYFGLPDRHGGDKGYKFGTKCAVCRSASRKEQATKITADSRLAAARKLHHLAARKFQKKLRVDPQWFEDEVLAGAIVLYLNSEIEKDKLLKDIYLTAPRNGITRKWLSWAKNRAGIDAELRSLEKAA